MATYSEGNYSIEVVGLGPSNEIGSDSGTLTVYNGVEVLPAKEFYQFQNSVEVKIGKVVGVATETSSALAVDAIAETIIVSPSGSISLTGVTPVVSVSNNIAVSVPTGSIDLIGITPTTTISEYLFVNVPLGGISLTGITPTVSVTDNVNITVPVGNVTLSGVAPLISLDTGEVTIQVPTGSINLTGIAPRLSSILLNDDIFDSRILTSTFIEDTEIEYTFY